MQIILSATWCREVETPLKPVLEVLGSNTSRTTNIWITLDRSLSLCSCWLLICKLQGLNQICTPTSFHHHRLFLFLTCLSRVVDYHRDNQRIQTSDFQFSSQIVSSVTIYLCTLFKAKSAFFSPLSFQNTFLQETVRRECEERFELTEALSQAREQLLELRKLRGSLPFSPCSLSKGSLTSPAAAVSNHGERSLARLNSEKGIQIPSLRGVSKPTTFPTSDKPKRVGSSGLPILPQPHPPRGGASSANETRQRLAAILRRRRSQQWSKVRSRQLPTACTLFQRVPGTHCNWEWQR